MSTCLSPYPIDSERARVTSGGYCRPRRRAVARSTPNATSARVSRAAVGDLGEKDPAEAFKKPQCSTLTILELRQTHPLLLLTTRASRS